ncbi:MAG: hypothetical protein ACTHMR_09820, partial [Thermomicrobiales bacterium]
EGRRGAGHLQSVVFGGALLTIGVLIFLIGLLADLIASVRRLLEDTLYRVKKMELQMERERGEREQLLASILNFDQNGELPGDAPPDGHSADAQSPLTLARTDAPTGRTRR